MSETDKRKYFIVAQRRVAAGIGDSFDAIRLDINYTSIKTKKKSSAKKNIQTFNADDVNDYCVFDAKDRLVKPKKLTRKGRILHIEVEDNYSFDLLNFFEGDVRRDISPKFFSHIDKNSGGFDVIDGSSGDVVVLHPNDAVLGWCARQDMPASSTLDDTYSQYAVEDLRASRNPVIPDISATSAISQICAADSTAISSVLTGVESSDMFTGLLPYLLRLGAMVTLVAGAGAGAGASSEQVIPNLTIQGRIMLGPVVDGNDLYVIIYDAKGNVLGIDETINTTKDASGVYVDYQITLSNGSTYNGAVTVCLSNKGVNSDYISEYLVDILSVRDDAQIDIGTAVLYAMDVVSSGATIKTINITQATDLVARHFIDTVSGTPKLGSAYTPANVDAANKKIASLLLGSDQSIVTLTPESTIDANGDPSGTSSEYALLLHSLDIYLHEFIASQRDAVITAQSNYDSAKMAHATANEASDLAAKDAADKAAAAIKSVGTSNEAVAKAEAESAAAIAASKAADAEVATANLTAAQTALSAAQEVLAKRSSDAQTSLVSWDADKITPILMNILKLDSYLPGKSDAPYKHLDAPDGPDKTIVDIYQGVGTIGDDSQYTTKLSSKVFNVSVTDTGAVKYSITGGADQGLFDIDQTTGLVTWKSTPQPPTANKVGDKPYEVIVTASKAGLLSAVSQLLRVHVDVAPPDNPDLSDTVATQLTDSINVNAAEASAGKSIAANIQAPASQDIGSITISFGGILSGDVLALNSTLSHALDANFSSSSISLGGVVGLKYDYDYVSHNLILKCYAGGAFAATEIDNIIAAIKLQTTGADGVRTATICYNDLAGNSSASSAVSTLKIDKTSPLALDLRDDISPTIEDADHLYLNATVANAGKSIAEKLAEITDTDIGIINVLIGGAALDTAKDQLVLDVAQGLNAKFSGSNATIGGIGGIDYNYDPASKILSLTPHVALLPFVAADLNDIIKALLFKTTSSIQGDRTATISCIDLAGNITATAVTTTLTIDTISPKGTLAVSTVETDGATACLPGWADRFLLDSETHVVLKVDSATLGSSALKVGDVITLQIKDVAASTAAGHDVFTDLVHTTAGAVFAINDKYTYTVTADDIASGDGLGKAAYMQVEKGDLTSGLTNVLNIIRANIVDLAGNDFDTAELGITVQVPITLTLDENAIDLDVTSQIVLTSSQELATAVADKKIVFTNLGGDGFAGENSTNTFWVYANDTRYVTIKGDKIIIKTPWDFDFANDYQITLDVGAFKTKADINTDAPELETEAVLAADAMNFNTVAVGGDFVNAAQGNVMLDDGTVDAGKKWFSVGGSSSLQSYDLGSGAYAMVFKDNSAGGQSPTINDGVETDENIKVDVTNFDSDDLIYADDQNNDAANLNSKSSTQVIDYGSVATQKNLHFDPLVTGPASDGATFTLTSASNLSIQDVLDRLNISNSRSEPTPITALTRLDISTNQIGASTTDLNPLRLKVTAAVEVGDHIQLVYIDANGAVQNIGSEYIALASDKVDGCVILSLSKTLLLSLPQQEGYNQVFAKLTNTSGGTTYSSLLGGDSGVYLDAVSPTLSLTAKSDQDLHISTGETKVDLVVSASHLSVGDVLVLKLGATQLGTWAVTAANYGTDATFTVASAKLAIGPNTLTVTSTDAAGNAGTSSLIVTLEEYVEYSGRIGFGPVLADNDLLVTAYDNAGNAIAQSAAVSSSGTYSLQISTSYKGAITLRVSSSGTKTDYWDEFTAKAIDMGDGSIAAVAFADGNSKTIHISKLTDLVARQLSFGNAITASEAQVNAYNLQLAKLLIDTATTTGITGLMPSFVVNSSGTSTATAGNKYGQLLAQISSQAKVLASSMDTIQAELSSAISWNWAAPTATLALNGTLAKQVVLLCKVAQAAALEVGTSASLYLTAVDFANYGFTGISTLSSARQADFISRIVSTANTGAELDTLAELQALANKETALAKIQDYANSNANPIPTLADYTAAGITNVSAANLFAVNSKMVVGSAVVGAVPVDGLIQAVVNLGVSAQSDAIAKIVTYADGSAANTAPSVSTYELAGVTGATADNLAAINVKLDAVNAGILTTGSATIVADLQATVTSAISGYAAAFEALRAYIIDGLANTAPDAGTYTDLGLKAISSADQISSANYYLNTVMADADALLSDSSILSKLTLQQTALNKINAYAVSSANASPSVNDYIAAGITDATVNNLSLLNTAVDQETKVDNAEHLATILVTMFSGVSSLVSISRAGTSVIEGSFTNDAYLNAKEVTSGQSAKFTITFDRSVNGLAASNFGLTDISGNSIAGATPTLTLTNADSGIGKVWQIEVTSLNGITSDTVRLNLINSTGVTDTISGKALGTSTYTLGQSYTVDTVNTLTLEAAADEDLVLTNTETSINLFVSAANLTAGDSLKLLKADGTQIGSTVVVTTSFLETETGVIFNVPKSSLVNGDNVLTLHGTDVAGNTGSVLATVNVSEYIDVTGVIGLPSKVLSSNDLAVSAYDASGNLLGVGTVDATSSTYTLKLLKSQTGYVQLKLSSTGAANDYWDTSSAAQADMGSTTVTAVISADGAAKSANITLLTDVASRLIGGIANPATSDISAVNKAITKLLVSTSSSTEITSYSPDFVTDTLGTSTTSAASVYGQILAQLAMQAKIAGSSLEVALSKMANGITWDGTNATLSTTFAKDVFFLAKAQLAAALNTGASASAYLTAQDFADYGIADASSLTVARQADFVARIVATNNNGTEVDTRVEVQVLADKVAALGKIQDYADLGTTAPTLADYAAAGITVVTQDNLTAVNLRVLNSDAAGTSTDALVQDVVDTGVTAHATAVAKIASYADLNTNEPPTLADYMDAGITGVTAANLITVNAKLDQAAQTAADTTSEIQKLAFDGIAAYGDALVIIKAYIGNPSLNAAPTASTYEAAGLPSIDTDDEVANANYYLSSVYTPADASAASDTILSALTAQHIALAKINSYAVSIANTEPSVNDYVAAGITNATSGGLNEINDIVETVDGITTVSALKTLLATISPSLTSIALAGTSVVNGAFQSDNIINGDELKASVKFTVTFDLGISGLASSNFALVDGVTGVNISGATPSFSITTNDNKVFTVVVSNLTGVTNSTLRLDLVNSAGIVSVASGKGCLTTSYTSGPSYTVDNTFNNTIEATTGEDLTLTSAESAANIFVNASKLAVGDTLALKIKDGASLATTTVSAADMQAGGVTLTVNKSSLTSPAEGATTGYINHITLTHSDTSGNVKAVDGEIVIAPTVTVGGTVGLGPVVSTADLSVNAYDVAGSLLASSTVNAATGTYSMAIDRSYSGPMLIKLINAGSGADYRDEATNTNTDLGSSSISVVVNANGSNITANITALTDIASRKLTVSSGMLKSGIDAAEVEAVNSLITQKFIDSTNTSSIASITPDFTVSTAGVVNTSASRYGQVLAALSKQAQAQAQEGQNLSSVQTLLANSITWNYNSGLPNGSMTLEQYAKDVVFLAKVAQAAQLSLSAGTDVSTVLTTQDLIDFGVPNFSGLNSARQTDVIRRIVSGADDGSATDSIDEVKALVTKVTAIGVIQDYRTSEPISTTPSRQHYIDSGITGVTESNLFAVNSEVLSTTISNITTDPDSVIASAAVSGAQKQTTAFAVITSYATSSSNPAPTVADYTNAGITGVASASLAAVNAKVEAAAATDVSTVDSIKQLASSGLAAHMAALTAISSYLANSGVAAPTLEQYRDASLAAISTADQVSNANYLLGKVLTGSSLTSAQIATNLSDQITAVNTINAYAASNTTTQPTVADYNKAGLTQVTADNYAEVNARIDAVSGITKVSDILVLLKAIDIDSVAAGLQATTITEVGTVINDMYLFAKVNATYTDDIATVNVVLSGADLSNDYLGFGAISQQLNGVAKTGSNVTINGVSGVEWSYGSGQKFVFKKTDETAFTAVQAQLIAQALKFTSTNFASNTQNGLVVTLTHTDMAGTVSSSATSTVIVDTNVVAADLSASTADIQHAVTSYVNALQAVAGKALVTGAIATPTDTDIKKLSIVMGGAGLDASADKLVLDVTQALSGDFSASNVSVAGVSGVDYQYTASTKTLILSLNSAASFAPANIPALVNGILFKSTSAIQGDRTLTIRYIDQLSNEGQAATSTIILDTVVDTPFLSLALDDGTSPTDNITTNGAINVAGVGASDTWSYSLDGGTTWTTGTGTSIPSSAMGAVGTKTVHVKATDEHGNTATSSLTFNLETAISNITAISSVADNNVTSSTSKTTSITGSVTRGTSTDDTTPTLSGTVSANLAANEVVAIYDGATKLGNATVDSNKAWTYTPAALTTGSHSFTARVERITGVAGPASEAYTTNVVSYFSSPVVGDDVGQLTGQLKTARYIMLARDVTVAGDYFALREVQVLSGGVNVALGKTVTTNQGSGASLLVDGAFDTSTGQSSNRFATPVGNTGTKWVMIDLGQNYVIDSLNVTCDLTTNAYLTQAYYSTSAMKIGATAAAMPWNVIGKVELTPFNQSAGQTYITLVPVKTDDTTPTLSGTLTAALGTGEVLHVYKNAQWVGVATVNNDNSWSYTSATLSAGIHTFIVMVQDQTNKTYTQGRVVSNHIDVTVDTTVIATTVEITELTDNVSGRTTTATGVVANGTSTDDDTPTLAGKASNTVAADQVVAIYDGSAKIGFATVTGTGTGTTWTYTPTALTSGLHSFSARVESMAGVLGTASNEYKVNVSPFIGINSNSFFSITDDVGPNSVGLLRYIMVLRKDTNNFSIKEMQVISGGVNVALNKTVTSSMQAVNATNKQSNIVDDNLSNSFNLTDTSGNAFRWVMIDLGQVYNVDLVRLNGMSSEDMVYYSDVPMVPTGTTNLTIPTNGLGTFGYQQLTTYGFRATDGFYEIRPTSAKSDDNTPTLSGTLASALGSNEELAVYANSNFMGIGTVNDDKSWTYTPTIGLADGTYTFQVVVQNIGNTSLSNTRLESSFFSYELGTVVPTATLTDLYASDNASTNLTFTGDLVSGSRTDDNTPTLKGKISGTLNAGDLVAIYDGTTKLAYATVTGGNTTWEFTPTTLTSGSHTFTARVESKTGVAGPVSAEFVIDVLPTFSISAMSDNAGATTGIFASGATTDDKTVTLSGSLSRPLAAGDELAIYGGGVGGGFSFYLDGVATVTTDASGVTTWSYSSSSATGFIGGIDFKAVIQSIGVTNHNLVKAASASHRIFYESSDTTFSKITDTNITIDSVVSSSVKTLAVASNTTVDMQNYAHADINLLNLAANATAKIDLDDILQNDANIFNNINFSTLLTGTSAMSQLVVLGVAGSAVEVSSIGGGSWTKLSTSVSNSGHTYDVYNHSNNTAQLLIDQLVSRSGAVI
jgi:Bacterial Ig-like domain